MAPKLLVANFKDYLKPSEAATVAAGIARFAEREQVHIAVAARRDAFPHVADAIRGSNVSLCAQNISLYNSSGTDRPSVAEMEKYGCRYAMVGHSEVRWNAKKGESTRMVREKIARLLSRTSKIDPILCIGETGAAKQKGGTDGMIEAQISTALKFDGVMVKGSFIERLVIAYEPVWAISRHATVEPPNAEQINAICGRIREFISDRFGDECGKTVRIIYGGSVGIANISSIVLQRGIDGALVGKASTIDGEFTSMIKAVSR